MSICMVILGFVTGFREIVKERPMLDLERRHGLRFAAYVVAKIAALAVVLAVPLLITPQILLGATILPIRGGVLAVIAKLFSPLSWAHRGCRSEGEGVPVFWQNLGHYDPALWIPYAALSMQILMATLITILLLRWQEQAGGPRDTSHTGNTPPRPAVDCSSPPRPAR